MSRRLQLSRHSFWQPHERFYVGCRTASIGLLAYVA